MINTKKRAELREAIYRSWVIDRYVESSVYVHCFFVGEKRRGKALVEFKSTGAILDVNAWELKFTDIK